MSQAQNLPKQTRILIKDLLFQAKYQLSHTQMDLMAYLVNVPFWAKEVEKDYFVITSNKILADLPHIHPKTLEATLKILKDEEFIHTKLVDMPTWNCKNKVRAIKLTYKSQTYIDKLILPSQDKEVIRLKKALKVSEEKNKALEALLANIEVPSEEKPLKKEEKKHHYTPDKDLITFIEDTSKTFAKTGENICNCVPNWTKEAVFNINSYAKLSIKIDNNEKQIREASQINHFWLWLFTNQHRVGNCIDLNKKLDFEGLKERYLKKTLQIDEKSFILSDLILSEDGIAIEVQRGEMKTKLRNPKTKETNYYTVEECERLILGLL
jgi:hypothetical protein